MENKNIDVYRYMDDTLKKERENELKKYLFNSNNETNNLSFFDLDFYQKKDDLRNNIKTVIYKSKLDKNITLTKYQIEILSILDKNNIFLSAPTSFGKTFIMLEYIFRNISILKNIIIVVPTLALMNELLKKIYKVFGTNYNICINGNEKLEEKNIFIFVPERSDQEFVKKAKNLKIDFLIFDEIYKLQGSKKEIKSDDRLLYMNKVYLDLISISKKIALLGPYINNISFENTNLNIVKYYTNFLPVYNKVEFLSENEDWINYINASSNLIYFESPQKIYKKVSNIFEAMPEKQKYIELYKKEIEYLENNIGNNWFVISLLKRGIGIHHGKTPMYLRKFFENEYNQKNIHTLLCTSTLMEGINTPTENLIVIDNPKSAFKLNNLIGRVGRLNTKQPIIGNILLCDKSIINELNNTDKWLDLKILAEDKTVYSNDEVIYLNKKYENDVAQSALEEKIELLDKKHNINKEKIITNNVEFDKTYKYITENYIEKFNSANNLKNCIDLAIEIIPAKPYLFNKNNYSDLSINTEYQYLPYKYYLIDILYKKSFKEIIEDFNNRYNTTKNIENINIFIDALYDLNNYIKFKFTKILNYINTDNIENPSSTFNQFIGLVSSYSDMEIASKLLDDLGINSNDSKEIINKFDIKNEISASKLIFLLKQKSTIINEMNISPFTKNNINNL